MLFVLRKGKYVRFNEENIKKGGGRGWLLETAQQRKLVKINKCYWSEGDNSEVLIVGRGDWNLFAKYFEQESVCSSNSVEETGLE